MNTLHSPIGDDHDAAEEMPAASLLFLALSFFAILFVVFAALWHFGLPSWRLS